MTDYRDVSIIDGRVIAANNGKRVRIGEHDAIVCWQRWVEVANGEHNQVALDLLSDASTREIASAECQAILARVFADLV